MVEKMLKSSHQFSENPLKSHENLVMSHMITIHPHLIRRNPPAMLQGLSLGATHLGSVAVGDADLLDQTCLGP